MKRGLLFASTLLVLGGCASGGGGGGGAAYTDCFTDYCVEYDDIGLQRLYLRTPGTPAIVQRAEVRTAAPRGGTQVVTRNTGGTASASARMSAIPSSRNSASGSGGRRP
jgi:hypothetical protein